MNLFDRTNHRPICVLGSVLCNQSPRASVAPSCAVAVAVFLLLSSTGCRDMAGGQAIDSLQKAKTAAANASAQTKERFKEGLKQGGATDEEIANATGEKAPDNGRHN